LGQQLLQPARALDRIDRDPEVLEQDHQRRCTLEVACGNRPVQGRAEVLMLVQ
jgi:hypothetical protein